MDLMDGREAAKYIRVLSYWSLLDLAKRGGIPHVRVGKRIFFRAEALDTWIKEIETGFNLQQEDFTEPVKLRRV